MDEDEGGGGGGMLKKKKIGAGEVDFKEKAGTAWSHNFLNQKPWHPLSYPNQRRKWIAEQTNAQHQRRADEVAREFAQEQEFFRQTALISKKEKEKVEVMKAVSFMYVRPPGYNAESAKAAELEDERRRLEGSCPPQPSADSVASPSSVAPEEKKKPRPKDVFGRALPTADEFEVLKNAPRLETGLPARPKPFGIEVRNVKCLRCGNYGHQSGDRECPLKDTIMPNEENRLKRDDPLTSIIAHTESSEPLKWELKQKPGISPPRGGFKPDDPNQQIVAEDIFDEYGGFLNGGGIPDLLTNFSVKKSTLHSKAKNKHKGKPSKVIRSDSKLHKKKSSPYSDSDEEKSSKKRKTKEKFKKRGHSYSPDNLDLRKHHRRSEQCFSVLSSSDDSKADGHRKRSKQGRSVSPNDFDHYRNREKAKYRHSSSSDSAENGGHGKTNKHRHSVSPDDSFYNSRHKRNKYGLSFSSYDHKKNKRRCSVSPDGPEFGIRHKANKHQHSASSDDSEYDRHHKRNKDYDSLTSDDSYNDNHQKRNKHRRSDGSYYHMDRKRIKHKRAMSSDDSDHDRHHKRNKHSCRH